jgi:hypothetical protein
MDQGISAVIGAAVGGAVSLIGMYVTARHQAHSASAQIRDQHIREMRATRYSDFLTHCDNASGLLAELEDTVHRDGGPSHDARQRYELRSQEVLSQVRQASWQIRLIGTEQTGSQSLTIYEHYTARFAEVLEDGLEGPLLAERMTEQRSRHRPLRLAFLEYAHEALGVSD